ncbi:TolC family protein, partial [Klebsiella pneumoniae]
MLAQIAAREDAAAAGTIDLARRKNLPVVTLATGVGYQVPDYLGIQDRPWLSDYVTWNVTVGLTYNIWDNGSR